MGWGSYPMCERCWLSKPGNVELDPTGEFIDRYRQPVRLAEPRLEACRWCASPTISGIYVRADLDDDGLGLGLEGLAGGDGELEHEHEREPGGVAGLDLDGDWT